VFNKKKQKGKLVGGNQSREQIRNFMWETGEEILNDAPSNISSFDYSMIALHAMMKPRLEIIIALLLDLRDKKDEKKEAR